MPGYLYRVITDFVSEDELSPNKLKQINRDLNDNLHVLVLDEEVTVVKAEEQELTKNAVHEHRSTDDESCDFCYGFLAMDGNTVWHEDEA